MNTRNLEPRLPGDSYWVVEKGLLAGPYPGAPSEAETRRKLAAFLRLGVTNFIDLTEEGEGPPLLPYAHLLGELAEAAGTKVTHRRIAVRDLTAPSPTQVHEALAAIEAAEDAGGIGYVHCWGGVGRTGVIVGCYLIESGMSPDQAIARIADLRRETARAYRASPETPDQRALIEGWRAGDSD